MLTNNIYQLPIIKSSILKTKPTVRSSMYMSMPMSCYGFHYFVNQNRSKLDLLKGENFKTKTYQNIVNPYELNIPDYDKSIGNSVGKYFNIIGNIPNITSNNFYKIWEILVMFGLDGSKTLTINDDGECMRAVMLYRDKFGNDKGDKFYVMDNSNLNQNVIKYYDTEKKGKINVVKKVEESDLVIMNGSLEWKENNNAEMESYHLIMEELILGLSGQKKGGNMIIKFFEFYTTVSIKYLCILMDLYENVFVVKPLMSKGHETEVYVIGLNYKGNKDIVGILEGMIKKYENYVNDIFLEYYIPLELEKYMIYMNVKLGNQQYLRISNIMSYINSGNYYGDQYHDYRNKQIEAHDKWLPLFFPLTSKDLKMTEEIVKKEMKKILEEHNKNAENYMK